MRLVWKEQLRNFIKQCPDNIYLKPAERKLQEDYVNDQKVFSVRDRQSKDISKLFFDRFTSNQGDWTQDHAFIFDYAIGENADLTR